MMPTKILIVDDEYDLLRLVRYNLEKEGYEVLTALDGTEAMAKLVHFQPDLVILDLMLPDTPGFKICQALKQQPKTKSVPVIMLTARSSEDDRIAGFEAGADDYVIKPFSPKELVYRVKALLSRTRVQRAQEPDELMLGDLVISPQAHRVETRLGEPIHLSLIEFKLLLSLVLAPNRVKTREQLIEAIWEDGGDDISDRTVDTHIKRLRQKLGSSRSMIETIRGVGYRAISQMKEPVALA